VTSTFTKDQLSQLGMFGSTNGAALKPFVTSAAAGVKGGSEEIVIQFTSDGAALLRIGLPSQLGDPTAI
jgi:hypothetical protein